MSSQEISILIVDDSKIDREVLAHALSSEPLIKVENALSSGKECIEYLQSHTPSVILLDINLPDMDGYETTRQIRAISKIPVILVSVRWNYLDVENCRKALEVGAAAALNKLVSIKHPDYQKQAQELLDTIKLVAKENG